MANTLVERMLDLIEREYADALTLQTLSAAVGRQPAYLGRLFHHETGSTVRDYLTRVRLEHAADLVRGGVKIEAVALCVGYRSKKNFYKQFKRRYGTTPVRYRSDGERPSQPPEPALEMYGGGEAVAVADDMSAHNRYRHETSGTDCELAKDGIASVVSATNHAWGLVIRVQHMLMRQFARSTTAVMLTNDSGRYVCVNGAAILLTGYSASEIRDLSPADLFVSAPIEDTRCVWQLVAPASPDSPNAVVRAKGGDHVRVSLITLKNLLWGRPEMSTLLQRVGPDVPT